MEESKARRDWSVLAGVLIVVLVPALACFWLTIFASYISFNFADGPGQAFANLFLYLPIMLIVMTIVAAWVSNWSRRRQLPLWPRTAITVMALLITLVLGCVWGFVTIDDENIIPNPRGLAGLYEFSRYYLGLETKYPDHNY